VKLNWEKDLGQNQITGYGEDYVKVNDREIRVSVVVLANRLVEPWPVATFGALEAAHFTELARLGVEVVLLGTGRQLCFPHPSLTRALLEAGIGLEVMDTPAACRTYNILMGEGRKVAAALILSA
jgi:uncharacterized protein